MKLKLNLLHKVGLAVLVVGIGILIFGMVLLYKCTHMKDLSEMTLDDFKKGMYVKATISDVVSGYPINSENRMSRPVDLYTTQSQDTTDDAGLTYFLVELKAGSGEYVCVMIDEFLDTDLYYQIYSTGEVPYEIEGIVTYSELNEQLVKKNVSKIGDYFSIIYYDHRTVEMPTEENVSPYCVKVKYLGARKLWWLYSIPFFFAGIAVFIIGGRPFERVK